MPNVERERGVDVEIIERDDGVLTMWDGTPEGYLHFIPREAHE